MTQQSLRSAIVRLARVLEAGDIAESAQWCVHDCTACLPTAEAALVELAPPGRGADQWVITASAISVRELCELDLYTQAGPCRSCLTRGRATALPHPARPCAEWEDFAGSVRAQGFVWSVARPLRLGGAVIGALQLFGTTPQTPDEEDLELVHALAGIVAGSRFQEHIVQQRGAEVGQLHTALASRLVIEQAKGVLAVRHDIDLDQAFSRLRLYARSHRMNIHELAADVVDGRDISDPAWQDTGPGSVTFRR